MEITSKDISKRVFRRVQRDDMGEFSMDSKMLKTLLELDGKKTAEELALSLGFTVKELAPVVSRLVELGLVEPVVDKASMVNHDFFACVRKELSLAIGPIADVLIEDALIDLNCTVSDFPASLAAELVYMLARQIQREDKRIVFQQNMLDKLKELGLATTQ